MTDDELNGAAWFQPPSSDDELPCVKIGGVLVFAYFQDGELCIGVDYEDADEAVLSEAGTVPTRVDLSDVVYRQG